MDEQPPKNQRWAWAIIFGMILLDLCGVVFAGQPVI
jgi:hypothetical protein